eukprot:810975-Rhodomonas_salina.1
MERSLAETAFSGQELNKLWHECMLAEAPNGARRRLRGTPKTRVAIECPDLDSELRKLFHPETSQQQKAYILVSLRFCKEWRLLPSYSGRHRLAFRHHDPGGVTANDVGECVDLTVYSKIL